MPSRLNEAGRSLCKAVLAVDEMMPFRTSFVCMS
jgi:hypothetical protein